MIQPKNKTFLLHHVTRWTNQKKLDQSNLFKTVSTLSDLVSKWVNIYILYSQLRPLSMLHLAAS